MKRRIVRIVNGRSYLLTARAKSGELDSYGMKRGR